MMMKQQQHWAALEDTPKLHSEVRLCGSGSSKELVEVEDLGRGTPLREWDGTS